MSLTGPSITIPESGAKRASVISRFDERMPRFAVKAGSKAGFGAGWDDISGQACYDQYVQFRFNRPGFPVITWEG